MPINPFIRRDEISGFIEGSLRMITTERIEYDLTKTFRPDELIGCGRKTLYRKETKQGSNSWIKTPKYMECEHDYSAKCRWITILTQCSDIKVLDSWTIANDMKYNMVTKIDCIIEIPSKNDLQNVVYIRSIPSSDYEYIRKNGATRSDTIRVMIDMWLVELVNGIILYEDRNTLDFMVMRVIPQDAIINGIKAKAKELYDHMISSTIPSRPYKTNKAKECQECEFLERCWIKE